MKGTQSLFVLGIVLFAGLNANAWSIKSLPASFKGCGPTVTESQARALMKKYNLTTSDNATKSEIRAVGKGLNWVTELNGGVLSSARSGNRKPYPFKFKNGNGDSAQRPDGLHITRKGGTNGSNVTQLMHELGHLVGNQGGYALYNRYMGKSSCHVSSYAASRDNEEFAEVFASFVGNPNQLKNHKSPGCKKAFTFMRDRLFAKGEKYSKCAGSQRADISDSISEDVQHADGQEFIQEHPADEGQGVG